MEIIEMRTNGNRGTTLYKTLRKAYLLIHGWEVVNYNSSQIVVDSFGKKVCDYNSLPVEPYMEVFYWEISKFKKEDITPEVLENAHNEAKTQELRRRYRDVCNLQKVYSSDFGKFLIYHYDKYLHTGDDYPSNEQLQVLLRMSSSARAKIIEGIENAPGYELTSETMEVLFEEVWWDDNIAKRMDFLGF